MNGFEQATYTKMQSIHPDVIIRAPTGNSIHFEKIKQIITTEFSQYITDCTPYSYEHVVIEMADGTYSPALLTALDPVHEPHVTQLPTMVLGNIDNFSSILKKNTLLMGSVQARELGITLGSPITVLFKNGESNVKKQEIIVGGIFTTGIEELDARALYCSFDTFTTLFPESGINSCGLKLKNNTQMAHVIADLKKRLSLEVFSWKDLYPALVSALALEKYAMFIIVSLVMLIACMNMIALLFMYITYKKLYIALFKAHGMTDYDIGSVFVIIGMIICCAASGLGLCAGIIIGYVLDAYQLIQLPDVYDIAYLPAYTDTAQIISIISVFLVCSIIAVIIPTRKISVTSVPDIFKHEL